MNQPHCYVIAHATSRVVGDCTKSLAAHNWRYEIFPAVMSVTAADWEKAGVVMSTGGKMRQRPGAQGCWMSHWQLWNRCVNTNQPLVILEHDAVVQGPWPQDLDIETQLVKLYRTAECKVKPEFGRWSKGSHAYTVTPVQAARLIAFAQATPAQALDKHLGDGVLSWTFYSQDLVTLNPRRGPSITSPIPRQR